MEGVRLAATTQKSSPSTTLLGKHNNNGVECAVPIQSSTMMVVSLCFVFVLFLDLSPTATSFITDSKNRVRISLFNTQPTADDTNLLSRLFLAQPSESFVFTDHLVSKSGLPVCKYALGGAARSTQPTDLVHDYCQRVQNWFEKSDDATTQMAPFLFYYNPNRYPYFMEGVRQAVDGDGDTRIAREDLFLVSGGTDYSKRGMEQRLNDALAYSGGEYLDMFVLEYVCPGEDASVLSAISQARSWVESGKVRYVAASTHSHKVGEWLGSLTNEKSEAPLLDAMMLRYNMAHRSAAENFSFPICSEKEIPVLAFTTTRWNRLQDGHKSWKKRLPTTPDCLSFALSPFASKLPNPWPVQVVFHSARDVDELKEAMECLSRSSPMTESEDSEWKEYGDLEWNHIDSFDEYSEERSK